MKERGMEAIARRRPINRTAAQVTQPGPAWVESSKRIVQLHSALPLPYVPYNGIGLDLTGRVVGSLTVLGISTSYVPSKNNKRLWVCRCVCGRYLTRRSPAIQNAQNTDDCCDHCRQTRWLRQHATYLAEQRGSG